MRRRRSPEPIGREYTILTNCALLPTALQTCRWLNQASKEHQSWLNQAKRLQIPIPTDIIPSTAELKNWVRSDGPWVKPKDENDDRSLNLHWFNMRREDPDKQERAIPPFVMANFVPGGKFVVVLYTDGQIDLNEIKIESGGNWDLQRVAQYKQPYPVEFSTLFWSQLLTGTRLGRPLVAYVNRSRER